MKTIVSVATLLFLSNIAYAADTADSGKKDAAGALPPATRSDPTNRCKIDGTSKSAGPSSEIFDCAAGPLQFTAGPVSSGGFGTALKGNDVWRFDALDRIVAINPHQPAGLDFGADSVISWSIDGSWTTKPDAPSNFTATLGPEADFALWRHIPPVKKTGDIPCPVGDFCFDDTGSIREVLGLGVKGDLRYRYGNFKSGSTLDKANQFIAGGTVSVIAPWYRASSWLPVSPTVAVSYFKVIDTTGTQGPVPDDIKSDYLQTEFHTRVAAKWDAVGLSALKDDVYPIALDVKYDGSRATQSADRAWQSLWTLGLNVAVNGMPFKPAITYQSGKNGGFTYDRQFLLGFAMDLLGPK